MGTGVWSYICMKILKINELKNNLCLIENQQRWSLNQFPSCFHKKGMESGNPNLGQGQWDSLPEKEK